MAYGRPSRERCPGRPGTLARVSTALPLRPAVRRGLAITGGLSTALGFEPWNLWPLAFVGVGVLTLTVLGQRLRSAFFLGWLYGLAFLTLVIGWTYVILIPIPILLVPFESLWLGLLAMMLVFLTRLPAWPIWAGAAWVMVEYLYSHIPFGGFGWFRLGFTMADSFLAPAYPLIGTVGVSWAVAALGNGLAWVVEAAVSKARRQVLLRGACLAVALALALLPAVVASVPDHRTPAPVATIAVGMVQGNVDGVNGIEAMGRARSVTNNHLAETVTLMAKARAGTVPEPDFVLWPENSTDIDPFRDPETRSVVQQAVDIAGVPIMVGAITQPDLAHRQTTALWWDPSTGPGAEYHKRNLVPFGEWTPFRDQLLPLLPILELVGAQGVPGTGPGILDVDIPGHGRTRVGVMICFELAYDDTFRQMMTGDADVGGAQLVTVQSNNATYAGTGQIPQQWAMTRIRAMEAQRAILVATTNAHSGYITQTGAVTFETRQRTADSTVVRMAPSSYLTPAVRYGAAMEILLICVGVGALVIAAVRTARETRAGAIRKNGVPAPH